MLTRLAASFILVVALAAPVDADAPASVLFVGNSFSFYNNGINNHYSRLTGSAGTPARTRLVAISGSYLRWHLPGLAALLDDQQWDIVVAQDYSRGPIEESTAASFREAARKLARIVRDSGARPVLFMTWAYSDKPEMMALLDKSYTEAGRELGATVAPVGLAFARATKERPDIVLIMEDAKHPTLAGTYLATCTIYAALHGRSPEGLSYTAGLDDGVAGYLQQVAWDTVQEYSARD